MANSKASGGHVWNPYFEVESHPIGKAERIVITVSSVLLAGGLVSLWFLNGLADAFVKSLATNAESGSLTSDSDIFLWLLFLLLSSFTVGAGVAGYFYIRNMCKRVNNHDYTKIGFIVAAILLTALVSFKSSYFLYFLMSTPPA